MASLRSWAALTGAVTFGLCGCGKAGGGAGASQAAASSAPPTASDAAAAPSDTAVSSVAVSTPPPVAAVSPPAPTVRPAAAPAPQAREPTAAELLQYDPRYVARERRLESLYGNAKERDPTGQVEHEQAAALAARRSCLDRACLDAWFSRREAQLRQYVEN